MLIFENTDQFRLDKLVAGGSQNEQAGYRLSNKYEGEEITFTGKDMKRWEEAWASDLIKRPNASLNDRFDRLWKRFKKNAVSYMAK